MVFPEGFLWGAATAAYQIEGAAVEDGRCRLDLGRLRRQPGRVVNGDTGDVATDHYHRSPHDVALMSELGLDAYRFSVSLAAGRRRRRGDQRRRHRLLRAAGGRACSDRGIQPFLTLYHWDLPQALETHGGWANRDTALQFADYAAR